EIRAKGHSTENVVNGVYRVATPATFGVLTTIAAFLPILMISGISGQFFAAIGWVVVLCLFMSLIESKLILPAHLSHMRVGKFEATSTNRFVRFQRNFSDGLYSFIDRFYLPTLGVLLRNPYLALASFVSVLILSIGLVVGGIVPRVFFPDFAGEFMQVELQMNEGTPAYITHANLDHLAAELENTDRKL